MMTTFDIVWVGTVIAAVGVGIGCAFSDWRDLRRHRDDRA